MEQRFTPGPWSVDPQYLSEVQTAEMKSVASCWHEHAAGQTITVTGVLDCSLAESAANARLIAAAPDMFEALVAAESLFAHTFAMDGTIHKQMRAAITRATTPQEPA